MEDKIQFNPSTVKNNTNINNIPKTKNREKFEKIIKFETQIKSLCNINDEILENIKSECKYFP